MKVDLERNRLFVCILILFACWSNAQAASSLLDYHTRVHQASVEISSLLGATDEVRRAYEERVDSALYEVRSMLPPGEVVELDKKSIEVNNAWLHYEISEFQKLQSYDDKREGILMRIAERLNALDARLTELDGKTLTNEKSSTRFPVGKNSNQPSTGQNTGGQTTGGTVVVNPNNTGQGSTKQNPSGNSNQTEQGKTPNQLPAGEGTINPNQIGQDTTKNQPPTPTKTGQPDSASPAQNTANAKDKEAEKAKMNEILHRDEYSKKPPEESALEKFFNNLFKSEPQKKEEPKVQIKPVSSLAMIVQYIVIGIAFAAIAFVLYKLVPRFLNRERKTRKEKRGPRVILGETLEEDQTATDLLAEADRLARAGDIRGAIRKGYIALLCELGDRQVLSLSQYKTNRDYLRDIRTRIMLYAAMEQMTNSFERHWYGFAQPDENDWNNFRTYYQQAVKQG